MALIQCPECGSRISDKAEMCPYCGLPATYFPQSNAENLPAPSQNEVDYQNLGNVLVSFDQDYTRLFSADRYIAHRDIDRMQKTYGAYYKTLKSKLVYQLSFNNCALWFAEKSCA